MAIAFDVFAIVSENINANGKLVGTNGANDRRAKNSELVLRTNKTVTFCA